MEISELIRLAREEDERRRKFGLDNHTINQLSRQREIVEMMEGIKRLNNIPNFPIEDLRTKINDL